MTTAPGLDKPRAGQTERASEQPEHTGALLPKVSPTDAPRERGRLDIAPRVVERVAESAARRVPGVRPVSHRVGSDKIEASARVLGDAASLHLQVAIGYPSPVRETCRRLRAAVVHQVRRVTDIEVTRLDLEVAELPHRPGGTRRVR